MPESTPALVSAAGFAPRGHSYLWQLDLVTLHGVSDLLIAVSYLAIPLLLWRFARRRRDVPYHWMFLLFGAFIVACGVTHLIEVWTIWSPRYWLSGVAKATTAAISVPTAVLLYRLLPEAVALPSPTELRVALTHARASEASYRALLDASVDAFFVLEPNPAGLRIADINRAAIAMLGRPHDALVGTPIAEIPHNPLPALAPYLEDVLRDGRAFDQEVRWERADRSAAWYHVQASPMLRGVAVTLRDITARVSASIALREREEQLRELTGTLEDRVRARTAALEAANRELEAFSYTVSHDLRAPLRAIDAYTAVAAADPAIPLSAGEHLARVRASVRRMSTLIDDLLRLARLARIEVHPARIDLTALAGTVVAEIRAAEPTREVCVTIESGLTVCGDPALVRVVLENLLCNAWKYTSRVSDPRIVVEGVPGAPGVFVVRDNGAGFDMRFAARLFRPFERLHSAREFEGSGVGLAIVQRVVRRHGGSVRAEGEVGRGATFYVSLPEADGRPPLDLQKLAARAGA